ncbi:MAG: class I SAM-dependent RNA methyltransferase [Desulfovibrio sp.]|nr:class I SAM-dependent RNA methyltransferase [Desulfovibrio sp.]
MTSLTKTPPTPHGASANEAVTLEITGLSHDGRGVARADGLVAFIAKALPGQRVRARILRRKNAFIEGVCEELLSPAKDAVPPLCPHHGECGGCPLQTMSYAEQLRCKRDIVLQAFTRMGHFDRSRIDTLLTGPEPSPQLTGFRNKITLAFGPAPDGGLVLGQRAARSSRVCQTEGCALLPGGIGELITHVQNFCTQSGLPPYCAPPESARRTVRGRGRSRDKGFWRALTVRCGYPPDVVRESEAPENLWLVCLTSPADKSAERVVRRLAEDILAHFPKVSAFVHEERASDDALASGEKRIFAMGRGESDAEAPLLALPLCGRFFTLDAASFFQVNTQAAQSLAAIALNRLKTAARDLPLKRGGLLDLYCGVGVPGQLAAAHFSFTEAWEYDKRSVALAQKNAERAGLTRCAIHAGDAARAFAGAGVRACGAALVDPPRAGLTEETLAGLLALAPRHIVYVSCNPATLARDAARLSAGYELKSLTTVDLFPHTPHVETVLLLSKGGEGKQTCACLPG